MDENCKEVRYCMAMIHIKDLHGKKRIGIDWHHTWCEYMIRIDILIT